MATNTDTNLIPILLVSAPIPIPMLVSVLKAYTHGFPHAHSKFSHLEIYVSVSGHVYVCRPFVSQLCAVSSYD